MNKFVRAIPEYAKAVAGAVSTFGAAVGLALADQQITLTEWIGIGTAVLVGAGLVGAIPNRAQESAAARISRESVEAMARRARE